jgi:hypothetical protein
MNTLYDVYVNTINLFEVLSHKLSDNSKLNSPMDSNRTVHFKIHDESR